MPLLLSRRKRGRSAIVPLVVGFPHLAVCVNEGTTMCALSSPSCTTLISAGHLTCLGFRTRTCR